MVICLNCEGWGCLQCQLERRAAAGGEQGPTAQDLEFADLRAAHAQLVEDQRRFAAAHPGCSMLDDTPMPCSCESSLRELAALRTERDSLLAELAALRVPRGAA